MVSGLQTIESAVEAMRVGAFDYILKPFDLRQVEGAVERAIEYRDLSVAKRLYETHLEELVRRRTAELDGALCSLENAYRSTLKALNARSKSATPRRTATPSASSRFSLRLGRELGLDDAQLRRWSSGRYSTT